MSGDKIGKLPNTGEENYNMLLDIWERNNMKTFKDFWIFYNNADTIGFVEAVQKMLTFYQSMNIEPFKKIVSLPGIARTLLFKHVTEHNIFALFSDYTQDLYSLFDSNIVGGPSIAFCRYH